MRCPYCHDALGLAKRWQCPACRTRHHDECARENARCTVLGCGYVALRLADFMPPRPGLLDAVVPLERCLTFFAKLVVACGLSAGAALFIQLW